MINLNTFTLINSINEKIVGDVRYSILNDKVPVIFVLHGFKGFKDWGFIPYISEKIAQAGAFAVNFDFSLNGIVDPNQLLYDLNKFSRNTVSQELKDFELVLQNFLNGNIIDDSVKKNYWNGKIYLLGHSLGGAISILSANKNKNINKIALWASISTLDRYSERQKKVWREKGYFEFTVSQTNTKLMLKDSYLNDIENNIESYSLLRNINELEIPVLILHGEQDVSVPIKEAIKLADNCNKEYVKYIMIENTGHTFGCSHPFKRTNKSLELALNETISFFELL